MPEDHTTEEVSISDRDGRHKDASTPACRKTRKNWDDRIRAEGWPAQTTSNAKGVRGGMGASNTSVGNYWDKEDSEVTWREEADKLYLYQAAKTKTITKEVEGKLRKPTCKMLQEETAG